MISLFILSVLISRLFFLFSNRRLSGEQLVIVAIIQWLPLAFIQPDIAAGIYAMLALIFAVALFLAERKKGELSRAFRLAHLLGMAFTIFALAPFGLIDLGGAARALNPQIHESFLSSFPVLTSGFLLAVVESRLAIQIILDRIQILPPSNESGMEAGQNFVIDTKSLRAGRIIGMLERAILFVVILKGQFGAAGLILVAKGVTRFKELEKRTFAEYVLIGTLLSVIFALGFALATQLILEINK